MSDYDFEITVFASDREYYEVKYKTYNFKPISLSFEGFVPFGPGEKDTLRIAMILFASNLFEECPSMKILKKEMEGMKYIDFCVGKSIPEHFMDLLEESRSIDITEKVAITKPEFVYI